MARPVTEQPKKGFQSEPKNNLPAVAKISKDVENAGTPTNEESVSIQPKKLETKLSPAAADKEILRGKASLEKLLGEVAQVVVSQSVEKVETATTWLSLGCCKVETENRYELLDLDTGTILFVADEDSIWCCRNPCLCCDCICWCCHSTCASRRAFTMTLTANSSDSPLVLEMDRPCRSDCLPCCLQNISVRGKGGFLGSVQQTTNCVLPCTMCGLFPDHLLQPGGHLH